MRTEYCGLVDTRFIGQSVTLFRIVLYTAILIIFAVALVIIGH